MHFSDRKIKRINICPVRILVNLGVTSKIALMRALLQTTLITHYSALKTPPTGP